jgi:acyl carrier protein
MEKIKKLILKIQPEIDFSKEVNFINDGYLDSLDVIKLVTQLEAEFGVSIAGSDMVPANFETLGAIEKLVEKYQC